MSRSSQKQANSSGRTPIRVLCISGSLRRDSFNRKLLLTAAQVAPPAAALVHWDQLKAIPPFDEDDEHAPGEAVLALRDAIARSDAVLIATPQYNASLPGQLKNALDWASRPYETNVLRGKPVAVIGASPSPSGAARAQDEARRVLAVIGADVLDAGLALARAFEQFDSNGQLTAPAHRHELSEILERLAARTAHEERIPIAA